MEDQQKAEHFKASKQPEWHQLVQQGKDLLVAQIKLFTQSKEHEQYKRLQTPTALTDSYLRRPVWFVTAWAVQN